MKNMKRIVLVAFTAFVAGASYAATTNLTGVVTFERDDLSFFFIDDTAGSHWRVQGGKGAPAVKIGDLVHGADIEYENVHCPDLYTVIQIIP